MLDILKRNKSFRNFLLHQTFVLVAQGVFSIFVLWAIHAQHQNSFYTGLAGAVMLLPSAGSFLIGPFVDRYNKVALMRLSALLQTLAIGVLVLFPTSNIWLVLVMLFLFRAFAMLESPAFTAYLPKIVPADDLLEANSLTQTFVISVGLVLGIFLFRAQDGTGVELINRIVFHFLLIGFLLSFKLTNVEKDEIKQEKADIQTYLRELKSGVTYLKEGLLLQFMLMYAFYHIFLELMKTNFPLFIEENIGPYGSAFLLLTLSALVGGILGATYARKMGERFKLSTILISGFILAGLIRLVFIFMIGENFWLAWSIRFIYGAIASGTFVCLSSFFQKYLPTQVLGRIATLKLSLFALAGVLGAFLGGIAGELVGHINYLFVFHAITYLLLALFLFSSGKVRSLPKLKDLSTIGEEREND